MEIMRMHKNPEMTLNRLRKYSTTENPKFKRLYTCFYSMEFFKLAYSNIYSKPGNMTKASDGSTIDGMSEERINKLIQSFKDGTYQPTNLRRVNIPKKNGKTRPISIPSFNDKLVQEIIRMILEAIYEDTFSDHSHGFRPNRSCHTALEYVRKKFQATAWFIEGDIENCFENINHVILLNILREKITDLRFIHLINLFLKAGYIENWKYHKTYSGVPQGSIVSPILFNIYMDKFDKFMERKIKEFDTGTRRHVLSEYNNLHTNLRRTRRRLKRNENVKQNKIILKKQIHELKLCQHARDMMDETYKRMRYVRYADDFLIGIIGSKKEIKELNDEIKLWFPQELKLSLSPKKHKITHNSKNIRFLGYDIVVVRHSQKKPENGNIRLSVPYELMVDFIIQNRYGKWWNNPNSGKDELKGICRPELMNLDDLEILFQYNWKIRGLYNYYCLSENVYKLNGFGHIIQTSFMRTLAGKYKTSCAKLYRNPNYSQRKKGKTVVGVTHKDKFYEYFDGPFNKKVKTTCVDEKTNTNKASGRTSMIKRFDAHICEFCGDTEGPFEIHHVKKLKDLKGKSDWEKLMISRHRKTLVLCKNCHYKLHAGKL